jgi:glycosyltransferase involved in cell wall biosynthesis
MDDSSTDGTVQLAIEMGLSESDIFTHNTPVGLINSINEAYAYWKGQPGFEFLFIANNDILLTDGPLVEMTNVLQSSPHVHFIGPLTTTEGLGSARKTFAEQLVGSYFADVAREILSMKPLDLPKIAQVQVAISSKGHAEFKIPYFRSYRGVFCFFFGLDRGLAESVDHPGLLFHSNTLNSGLLALNIF